MNIASILSRAIFITLMINQAVHAIDARQCSENKILHFHAVHALSARQCNHTVSANINNSYLIILHLVSTKQNIIYLAVHIQAVEVQGLEDYLFQAVHSFIWRQCNLTTEII